MNNYISKNEIDGEVQPKFIDQVGKFIRAIRSVFHIHCFTKGRHSKNSYHYKSRAVDGHIGDIDLTRKPEGIELNEMESTLFDIMSKPKKTLFEQAIIARLSGLTGIGMYPDWKPVGGLHLDNRGNPITWVAINSKNAILQILEAQEIDKEIIEFIKDNISGQYYIYI